MTTVTHTYEVRAIEPHVAASLRELDDAGRRPRLVDTHGGGSPLRCCLRLSRPNEPVALVSYAPLRRWAAERSVDPGPYDEVGPVFIHPVECDGTIDRGLPIELLDTARVFRGYDATGSIAGGRLVEPGEDAERVLDELFADPETDVVHVRALEFGCFTFEVRRVRADRQL
jgi:hypothetical protein